MPEVCPSILGLGAPVVSYINTAGKAAPCAGCMAVEMLTGEPLFPGDSDVDQLWLILKCMGQLPPAYAEMLSCNEYFVVRALPH